MTERLSVEIMADVVDESQYREKFMAEKLEDLVLYHHTLGRRIRNHFGLWKHDWEPLGEV